jgi:hypothetical protein
MILFGKANQASVSSLSSAVRSNVSAALLIPVGQTTFALDRQRPDDLIDAGGGGVLDRRSIINVLADPVFVSHVSSPENGAMILKSETYHFHRLDLTRQAGFIVTIYDMRSAMLRSASVAALYV